MTEHGPIFWVAQMLAALAYAVVFLSNYSINRTITIAGRGVSAFLFTVEYVLLGMWAPAGFAAVNTVRCFSLAAVKKGRARRALLLFFIAANCALFTFLTGSFASWVTVLPLLGTVLSTVALSMGRVSHIKVLTVGSSAVWITFSLLNGLFVNVIGDLIALTLAAIAWKRSRQAELLLSVASGPPDAA